MVRVHLLAPADDGGCVHVQVGVGDDAADDGVYEGDVAVDGDFGGMDRVYDANNGFNGEADGKVDLVDAYRGEVGVVADQCVADGRHGKGEAGAYLGEGVQVKGHFNWYKMDICKMTKPAKVLVQ